MPEIARAFLVRETTMGQRISRAKARIGSAGLSFDSPTQEELPARLDAVLTVLYLVFNEGYLSTGDQAEPIRQELVLDAIRLARLLHALLPHEGEVAGLLALMLLAEARRAARVSPDGGLVTLDKQNRGAWDHAMIREAFELLAGADRGGTARGRYRILAAISATHCSAARAEDTDWPRIVALYDLLARIDPSPIVLLNRAVAVAEVAGPGAGLDLVDPAAGRPCRATSRTSPSARTSSAGSSARGRRSTRTSGRSRSPATGQSGSCSPAAGTRWAAPASRRARERWREPIDRLPPSLRRQAVSTTLVHSSCFCLNIS